jgi:hypothetical protein
MIYASTRLRIFFFLPDTSRTLYPLAFIITQINDRAAVWCIYCTWLLFVYTIHLFGLLPVLEGHPVWLFMRPGHTHSVTTESDSYPGRRRRRRRRRNVGMCPSWLWSVRVYGFLLFWSSLLCNSWLVQWQSADSGSCSTLQGIVSIVFAGVYMLYMLLKNQVPSSVVDAGSLEDFKVRLNSIPWLSSQHR